ncbi:MAG: Asp-tRNA(Asn)/Glu-tRNA(Gln) amidotransferase subunit GatB [Sulfolobales archaeon]|nr:Asp-tRNA(Asn)/Glu-tRNA(Gln) amidotransferase subunit GatB [Sulfolobales archaeon]MCG2893919.1 Asp-tRNA(Asn)/Glu-tRNA(Gln) amidotransferase subunit GatB [Sulfolobales archaeon]MCG2910293.1 Asp-tRNA(Asn)/Glu-tRNA(Gln) amidotransferase subunit GatB [Sulfolobales archaeon]
MAKIGLEVHVHITSLKTKLFCSCPSHYAGKEPNSVVCPVCLGLPGAIPVPNKKAIEEAIKVSLALNMQISDKVVFVRKHYFYPDMAKNYQISQYDGPGTTPIAKNGFIKLRNGKTIRIRRINIEEDPAKIVYPTGSLLTSKYVWVDYNRSGIGMLEIVTEPDIEDPKEAREFLEKLRSILEHLGTCDCTIEGSMRVDVNVSVPGGERVEVKNIGSIKGVEEALKYEIARQEALISQGLPVKRETRHWDDVRKVTLPSRYKEEETDYRYFPDPDLPPITITENWIRSIASSLPELPDARIRRFMVQYGLSEYDATVLVMDKGLADFYEDVLKIYYKPKEVANLLINDYLRWINEMNIRPSESKAKPEYIASLLKMMEEGVITIKIVKEILPEVVKGSDPRKLVEERGLTALRDQEFLIEVIKQVFAQEPDAVEKARRDPKVINYLVGQVMRLTGKRADPYLVNQLVRKMLEG